MALKKVELANPESCLNRAGDFEPVFVLRAHDVCASGVVRVWALDYRKMKLSTGGYDARAKAKFREAMTLADQMDAWRSNNARPIVQSYGGSS